MKKTIILLTLIWSASLLYSQEYKIANPGMNGIFIHAGAEIPNGQSTSFYIIERKEENSGWESIAKLKFPANVEQFKTDYQESKKLFPYAGEEVDPSKAFQAMFIASEVTDTLIPIEARYQLPTGLAARTVFYDQDVSKYVYYQYRVSQFKKEGSETQFISEKVKCPGKAFSNHIKVDRITHLDHDINVRWHSRGTELPYTVALFHYESNDVIPDFIRVNYYQKGDTIIYLANIENYSGQQYFIVPFDYYGNQGAPSDITYVEEIQPAINYFKNLKALPNENKFQIDLSWNILSEDDIKYVDILRSDDFHGEYKKISSVASDVTRYSDMNIDPDKIYYYRLSAQLTFKDEKVSTIRFFGFDFQNQPPIPPEVSHFSIDEKSISIKIRSKERFLSGVRIYRKRADLAEDPGLISDLISLEGDSLIYVDNSTLEGGRYYEYFVKTANNSGLTSDFSNPVRVQSQQLVEMIPITGLTSFVYLDSEVNLTWDPVMKDQVQVIGYRLYRKKDGGAWIPLLPVDSLFTLNRYIDQDIQRGSKYEYKVCPIDFLQREGACTYTSATIKPEKIFKGQGVVLWGISEGIFIQFSNVIDEKLDKFRIYRYQRGQKVKMIKELTKDQVEYLDKSAKEDQLYFYYITTVSVDGVESMPGEESGIRR